MIIRRAFYREAATTTTAIVAILIVVLVLFGMTAILGRAVRGDYAETIVLELLGWQTLKRVDLLLPLGLYLGVLLTLSRWYRDSEMTVLAACGISLLQLLRPVLVLAAVMALLTAAAAFYLTPHATFEMERLKTESAHRPDIAGVNPGTFTEGAAGGRIVYAEDAAADGSLTQVFVNNPSREHPRVILSRQGRSQVDERGDRFVVLSDGWAYEGIPGQKDYQIVRFDRYTVRIDPKPAVAPPEKIEALPTSALLRADRREARAEWHWRLSKPVLVFVLAAFALVLAYTDARRGRLANLFAAILIYFIYSNLLGLGQTLMKQGKVPLGVGLWWVHGVMIVVVAYLLYRRNRNQSLLPRLLPARTA